MIAIVDNTTDVSVNLVEKSLSLTDQMSNRKNTCSFSMIDQKIAQGKSVYVYDALDLVISSASGTDLLYVSDTYQAELKWLAGDTIIINARTANEKKHTILAVDHTAKTIQLTANLTANVVKGTSVCGRLIFGGVCQNNPDEEVGMSGKFQYGIKLVDWTQLYDRKAVVQQYLAMYGREIIGRMVYFFCPTDTSTELQNFETAWTASGTANAMADETTDRIVGTKSQKTSTSASGTAIWTKTISSQDISAYKHGRFWWKAAATEGGKITGMKLRLGTDASNYFEYTINNVGAGFEDCWNYESVILNEYSGSAGSPSLATIAWLQIRVTTTAAVSANSLFFDSMTATTGSFTIQNVVRGDVKFPDLRIPYQKASEVTEDIAKKSSRFWYIDYERDIHMFSATATPAPWAIDDTSQNYYDLRIETDISKLKNRQIVLGGEAPSSVLYTQTASADGTQTSFALDYKPKTLTMTVAGVSQTLGVEGFVDETTVQWVYNFTEKVVRKGTASTPTVGQAIVFTYYPYEPIRVSVTSPASIAAMKTLTGGDGIYDGEPIVDASLSSFEDARIRARAELTQWANAIRNASFGTFTDGLRAGMTMSITDSSRTISAEGFLIQSITWRQKFGSRFTYQVKASTTLFGLIEFIQMLLKRGSKLSTEPSELVDTILNVDEEIVLTPSFTLTAKNKVVYAALKKLQTIDFVGLTGNISATGLIDAALTKQWYMELIGSETGSARFDTSRHNNNAELRLTSAVGGNGKELQVRSVYRLAAVPNTLYTIDAWTEIQTALSGLGTGGGFQLVVKEWANQSGGSALASNTIFSAISAVHDFTKRTASFTTNASTAWISIEISNYRAIGTARIADVKITPATAETATLPGIASFSQAT